MRSESWRVVVGGLIPRSHLPALLGAFPQKSDSTLPKFAVDSILYAYE